mgnify:CR=1 FL=1
MRRHELRKERPLTKERFKSILHGEREEEEEEGRPWYFLRRNYLPLLMIMIFLVLLFGVRVLHDNQTQEDAASTEQTGEPMDYDEARDIFRGAPDE